MQFGWDEESLVLLHHISWRRNLFMAHQVWWLAQVLSWCLVFKMLQGDSLSHKAGDALVRPGGVIQGGGGAWWTLQTLGRLGSWGGKG